MVSVKNNSKTEKPVFGLFEKYVSASYSKYLCM